MCEPWCRTISGLLLTLLSITLTLTTNAPEVSAQSKRLGPSSKRAFIELTAALDALAPEIKAASPTASTEQVVILHAVANSLVPWRKVPVTNKDTWHFEMTQDLHWTAIRDLARCMKPQFSSGLHMAILNDKEKFDALGRAKTREDKIRETNLILRGVGYWCAGRTYGMPSSRS